MYAWDEAAARALGFLNVSFSWPGRAYTPVMRRLAAPEPPSSEITPESLYLRRREFLKNAVLTAGTAAVFGSGLVWLVGQRPPPDAPDQPPLAQAAAVAGEPTSPGEEDTA